MTHTAMRQELKAFYWNNNNIDRAREFAARCFAILDELATPELSVMEQKLLQYRVIAREFDPVIFPHCPFYYEPGTMTSVSDGARYAKGSNFIQASGWVYQRNQQVFQDQNPALWERTQAQKRELLYLICGPYNDVSQHFNFNNRPILEGGLKSVYEKAQAALAETTDPQEREFLQGVMEGMRILRTCAERFADKAVAMLAGEKDPEARENLERIAATARRVPWEAPKTLYEALNTLAFMRKFVGALEGVGPNTFGRVDVDLLHFYKADLEAGRLTREEARGLIGRFLVMWDCHYDHDMTMVGYADHELENTYTLGGCDGEGNPVWNDLTQFFLQATREEEVIFPKIKCRFSSESPKAYLDEINRAVIAGTSTILYQNDEATISALLGTGRSLADARDYAISGCWGIADNGSEKYDHGSYLNRLKPFEFALHILRDKMEATGLDLEAYDGCGSFDEFYAITIRNIRKLFETRLDTTRRGGQVWHKADALPIFSSTLRDCMEKRQDYTLGGGKYRDDYLLCFGLPNIVDSLLAIRKLVYESGKYTLEEYLAAVRANWQGAEELRREAIATTGFGDGGEESTAMGARFQGDLYAIASSIPGTYGGRVHIGHLTYTEIRWWGEKTLATPDGRVSGDYFSQGLTPSRLKKIPSVTDVIRTLAGMDASTMGANNVVNIILPSTRMDLNLCEAFLRSVAKSAIMSLQLNCTTREQLLDAQKKPEQYPNLIVRVCGFSARFTSLSLQWQQEVLSRNFYE